jgi:hypothetical protein
MTSSDDQWQPGQGSPGRPTPPPSAGVPAGQPGWGQPPPGYGPSRPAYGPPPPGYGAGPAGYGPGTPGYGAPPPGYGYGSAPPGYGTVPVQGGPGRRPGGLRSAGFASLGRLRTPDHLVIGGALLYLVVAAFPWASVSFDFVGEISASGYGFSSLVTVSAVLLIGAAGWALLPAFRDVPVAFPRSSVTAGLAALAVLFTLITWLRTLDYGFEFFPLLGLAVTVAVAVCAGLGLVAELRNQHGVPGGPPSAGYGAGAQAPPFGSYGGQYGGPAWPPSGGPAPRQAPPPGGVPGHDRVDPTDGRPPGGS